MPKRLKKITLKPFEYIEIVDSSLYFGLQEALRLCGIYFIDLNTSQIINGNVYITPLGMISSLPEPKTQTPPKQSDHFLIPPHIPKVKTYDIEATISIFEPEDKSQPTRVGIQVIDQNNLDIWEAIFTEVGKLFVVVAPNGNQTPTVLFRLYPLTIPDPSDTRSAIVAMLNNLQRNNGNLASAVSNEFLDIEEDDDWDEEEE